MWSAKIQNKLVIAFSAVVLLPLVGVGLYSINLTTKALQRSALQAAEQAVLLKAKRIEGFLQDSQSDMLFLSKAPALKGLADALGGDDRPNEMFWQNQLEQELFAFSRERRIYRQIAFVDRSGKEMVRVDSDGSRFWIVGDDELGGQERSYPLTSPEGADRSPRALREASVYRALSSSDERSETPSVPEYKLPIFDSRHRNRGTLVATLFPNRLLETVQEARETDVRMMLVNQDGFYLSRPGAMDDEGTGGKNLRDHYKEEMIAQLLSGRAGTISDGVDDIISYASIPVFPGSGRRAPFWVLVDVQPKSVVLGSVAVYRRIFAFMVFVSLLLALMLSVLLARRLTKPLTHLRDGARLIGHGNLDHRLRIHTGDEIEELAKAFNSMADRLQASYSGLEERIHQKTEELENAHRKLMQSEKLAAVGTLAAGVAHEINNPLDGILNCIARIRRRPDDVEQTLTYLDLMSDAISRIGTVVRQLLDFSRKHDLTLQPTDVNRVVEDTLRLAEYGLRKGKVMVEKDLDPALPPIKGDAHHLQQVFLNLTLNAIAAMPEGGTLYLHSYPSPNGNKEVCVEVRDTGMGIPREHMDKIFDPFYTTKRSGNGAGLGLSVSFNIVKEHEGTIEVESTLGQGTLFRVRLPSVGA